MYQIVGFLYGLTFCCRICLELLYLLNLPSIFFERKVQLWLFYCSKYPQKKKFLQNVLFLCKWKQRAFLNAYIWVFFARGEKKVLKLFQHFTIVDRQVPHFRLLQLVRVNSIPHCYQFNFHLKVCAGATVIFGTEAKAITCLFITLSRIDIGHSSNDTFIFRLWNGLAFQLLKLKVCGILQTF